MIYLKPLFSAGMTAYLTYASTYATSPVVETCVMRARMFTIDSSQKQGCELKTWQNMFCICGFDGGGRQAMNPKHGKHKVATYWWITPDCTHVGSQVA